LPATVTLAACKNYPEILTDLTDGVNIRIDRDLSRALPAAARSLGFLIYRPCPPVWTCSCDRQWQGPHGGSARVHQSQIPHMVSQICHLLLWMICG